MPARYARVYPVVAPAHLDHLFDYAIPADMPGANQLRMGCRVKVDFHGYPTTALVMETTDHTDIDHSLIKPILDIAGELPYFDPADAAAWRWIADRFASTFAAVTRAGLPKRVNYIEREWQIWPDALEVPETPWCPTGRITYLRTGWHDDSRELLLERIQAVVDAGYQAHVITPLPACPVSDALRAALGREVIDVRGEKDHAQRYRSFWRWRQGHARVLIGTQSSALWPAQPGGLGLLVVLDEANPAYKMRQSPRAHIRETALVRAGTHNVEVLLTSLVPSGQLQRLIIGGHVQVQSASPAQIQANSPRMHMVDRNELPIQRKGRFTGPVIDEITKVVRAGGRVIVVGAMKGSGTSIGCQYCKRRIECPDCGAGLGTPGRVPIAEATHWVCQVCAWTGPAFACPWCDHDRPVLRLAGVGQIAKELQHTFADAEVVAMEGFDQPGPANRPGIAVMTRGSVVASPKWLRGERAELAVIVDPETLLGLPIYDAAETALRLWADTARIAEKVMIQTFEPDHHAISAFSLMNPDLFWDRELERRQSLHFPPAGHVIALQPLDDDLAGQLRSVMATQDEVIVLGPDTDGRVLVSTATLQPTLRALRPLQERWAKDDLAIRINVDPISL